MTNPTTSIDATVTLSLSRSTDSPATPLPDPTAPPTAPTARFGDYEILGTLGRGGMGEVLKGWDPRLKRLVAIKMPLYASTRGSDAHERFLREARAAARLQHPNVCPIYEVGAHSGRPYIAMAFLDGTSLTAWARKHRPSARQIAELLSKVAHAVAYAHEHAVVHRDIKPSNIIVDRERGIPYLTDFGLAKDLSDDSRQMTQSGDLIGTPAYMSPEQAAGHAGRIGAPTDVYSLGAVLYELLCGQPPFCGPVGQVVHDVQTSMPVPPRRLSPHLHRDIETICLKAMAKDPLQRYASAAALAADLDHFCNGESIVARPEGVLARTWRFARKNRRAVILFLVLLLVAGAALGYLARQAQVSGRTSDLVAGINDRLKSPTWDERSVDECEALISQLDRLSPRQAQVASRALLDVRSAAIERTLRQPEITTENAAVIGAQIARLQRRDPPRAAALLATLEQRLRDWQQVFVADFGNRSATQPFAETLTRADQGWKAAGNSWTPAEFHGNREVEARFLVRWADTTAIGVALKAGPRSTYRFLAIKNVVPDGTPLVRLQIERDGTILRSEDRMDTPVADGVFNLLVQQQGGHLRLQLNRKAPLEFEDFFATIASGPAGTACAGAGVQLQRFRVSLQAMPAKPSSLEVGNELYAAGDFARALEFYRGQNILSEQGASRAEALFKAALCLQGLNRTRESEEVFKDLWQRQEHPWDLLAGAHLWVQKIRDKDLKQADSLYALIESRVSPELLGAMMPQDARKMMVDQYARSLVEPTMIGSVNDEDIARIEYVQKVLDHVSSDSFQKFSLLLAQERAYFVRENYSKTAALAEEWFAKSAYDVITHSGPTSLVEDYGWSMRMGGREKRAIEWLTSVIKSPRGQPPMNVELARLYLAAGDVPNAKQALMTYLDSSPKLERRQYAFIAHAWVIKGIIESREGDDTAARRSWERAVLMPGSADYQTMVETHQDFVISMIAGTISRKWSESDAEKSLEKGTAIFAQDGGPGALIAKGNLHIPPKAFLRVWEGPRGRDAIEKIVLRTIPHTRARELAMTQLLANWLLESGFATTPTDRQEAVTYALAADLAAAAMSRTLKNADWALIGASWKGIGVTLFWPRISAALKPALRTRYAYVLAQRLRKIGSPDEARTFLQFVVSEAKEDSLEHGLAVDELAREKLPK